MLSPNCYMANYMPDERNPSSGWHNHPALYCFRNQTSASRWMCGDNLWQRFRERLLPDVRAKSGLLKWKHPAVTATHSTSTEKMFSLLFHKYRAYLEDLITIIQGGRVVQWSRWPYHHVEDKSSIAQTAAHPGRRPRCKIVKPLARRTGSRSGCDGSPHVNMLWIKWSVFEIFFLNLERQALKKHCDSWSR